MNAEGVGQYQKLDPSKALTQNLPYDFESILHYGGQDFSIDGIKKVMVRKDKPDTPIVGDKKVLSLLDIQAVRLRYNCTI